MSRFFNAGDLCLLVLTCLSASAQEHAGLDTNSAPVSPAPTAALSTSNAIPSPIELSERIRSDCIKNRRSICGKILRIVPEGIIVECGYTNLLRQSLSGAWLLPGTVITSRAPNLVESSEPNALCVGTVCLSHLPRGKPHRYDYVVISGYPMGQYTYTSVGNVTKTVRRFSANLEDAIKWNFAEAQRQTQLHRDGAR